MKHIYFIILFVLYALVGNSQTIDLIGYYNINGTIAIASIPGYMILTTGDIVDISDPANPVLNSKYSFSDYAASIIEDDNYAYFGTEMTGKLFIADISNIDFPLHMGYLDFSDDIGYGVYGMDKNDSVLFAAIGAHLCSIDITDKTNPQILDTLFISGGLSRDVALKGDYAFVAHTLGMKVVDISDPENLEIETSIGSGYNAIDLGPSHAYLAKSGVGGGSGGADVFDISDPLDPSSAFSIPNSSGTCWDIEYRDNYIYMATNNAGLYLYKVENNFATELAHYYNPSGGQTFNVCLHGEQILLAELITGVAVLEYDSVGVGIAGEYPIDVDLNIFPNPSSDLIRFEHNMGDTGRWEVNVIIYDSQGLEIEKITYKGSSHRHDISAYAPGVYYAKFSVGAKDPGVVAFIVQ